MKGSKPVTEADWKLYNRGEWPPKTKPAAKPKPKPRPKPATTKPAAKEASVAPPIQPQQRQKAASAAVTAPTVKPAVKPRTAAKRAPAKIIELDEIDDLDEIDSLDELVETIEPVEVAKSDGGIKGCEQPRIFTKERRELTEDTSDGWAAIAFAEEMLGMALFPWQKWLLIHALELNEDFTYRFRTVIMSQSRQNGKCLDALTNVLTVDGWKQMGDLKPGDQVFHPDGYPVTVTHAFDPFTPQTCYEVTTTDGRHVVCDAEHLWTVKDMRRSKKVDGITTHPWETLTTTQLVERGVQRPGGPKRKHNDFAFRLPRQQRIVSKPVDLPVDPYVFGAWLGDGTSTTNVLSVGDQDIDEMRDNLIACGMRIVSEKRLRTTWELRFNITGAKYRDWFQARMMRLGVWGSGNKHVPSIYLTAGTEQRKALLAGLLDTDGYISKAGQVGFTSTNERLSDAVLYLARSLGWRATKRIGRSVLNGHYYGPHYEIYFTPDESPFRMARKSERVTARVADRSAISIKSIIQVEPRPVRCIKVDRPDGLFLAGEGLIPTHNTFLMVILALWHLYCKGSRTIIATAQDLSKAEDAWNLAVEFAQSDEELQELIRKISLAHPKLLKVLNPITGKICEYRVASKSRGGGRGYSGDLVLLDELREHQTWDSWAAISKDLADSTPMLKADGAWTTIGELQPGDQIFAPSGKPTTVLAVYPVNELRPMYRVTSTDRRSVIASASHLWCVKDYQKVAYRMDSRKWEVYTTEELLTEGLRSNSGKGNRRFKLPLQHELIDLPIQNLPLDPYLLGAWLGDGDSNDGIVHVGFDYLEEITTQLQAAGATVPSVWRGRTALQVRVHINGRPLRPILREMNLLRNKHVPVGYETASTEQRLALLQGLLDTDGCVVAGGEAKFSSNNEGLVDTALFLARSFGWNAWKRCYSGTLYGKVCGPHWEVQFLVPPGGYIPFRLPRKIAAFKAPRTMRPRLHTAIDSIESMLTEPSTCIAVDSDDHLFLAGRDLIPTHNTQMARPKAQAWAFTNAGDSLSIVWRHQRAAAHQKLGWPDGDQDAPILGEIDPNIGELLADLEKEFGADMQVGWFEWSAPPNAKRTDRQAWASANGSMNHTEIVEDCVTERAIAHALYTDPQAVFDQEVMCRFVPFADGGPFPAGAWQDTVDKDGLARPAAKARSVMCLEVSVTRSAAVIAKAAVDDDGNPVVGVSEMLAGTDWCLDWLLERRSTFAGVVVRSGAGSPVLSLLQQLLEAGLPVIEWKTMEVGAAFGQLFDRVRDRTVKHLPHQGLDAAACSAVPKLQSGGGWIVDALKSPSDVSPLYAVTGAVWGLSQLPDDGPSMYSNAGGGREVFSF